MANFIPFGNPGHCDKYVRNLDVAAFETPRLRVGKRVRWQIFKPHLLAVTRKHPLSEEQKANNREKSGGRAAGWSLCSRK